MAKQFYTNVNIVSEATNTSGLSFENFNASTPASLGAAVLGVSTTGEVVITEVASPITVEQTRGTSTTNTVSQNMITQELIALDSDIADLDTTKANKADVYTKAEIDTKLTSTMTYKGAVATQADLPTTGNAVGDVYNVTATGENFAWDGTAWDKLGQFVDLSVFYTKTETDALLDVIRADITTIEGDIVTIQGDITTIEGDITTLTGKVTTIEGDIITINGKILLIENSITFITDDILAIQGNITTINTNITNITNDLQDLIDLDISDELTDIKADITGLDTRLTTAEGKITALETTVATLPKKFGTTITTTANVGSTITHNLNTTDVLVQVYEAGAGVLVETSVIDANNISIISSAADTYRVVVIG